RLCIFIGIRLGGRGMNGRVITGPERRRRWPFWSARWRDKWQSRRDCQILIKRVLLAPWLPAAIHSHAKPRFRALLRALSVLASRRLDGGSSRDSLDESAPCLSRQTQ